MDSLSALFERFLRERRYLKNVTPKTIVWYETAFKAFTRTITIEHPSDVNKALLSEFVVKLRERGVSPISCNTYGKALNVFFGWLLTEGHLQGRFAFSPQRTEKRVLQLVRTDDLRRLLAFKPKTMAQWRACVLA